MMDEFREYITNEDNVNTAISCEMEGHLTQIV